MIWRPSINGIALGIEQTPRNISNSFKIPQQQKTLRPCINSIRVQYSLPYTYEMVDLLEVNKALSKTDVDSFWWLKKSMANEDLYLRIRPLPPGITKGRPPNEGPFGQEPIHKVPRPKGRTRVGIPDVGQRNYSQFEQRESFEELDATEQSQSWPAKRAKVQ